MLRREELPHYIAVAVLVLLIVGPFAYYSTLPSDIGFEADVMPE
jgi:hypothetical protein